METLYKCDGCGGSFEASEVFMVNGGEKFLCTGCHYEQDAKFDAITIEIEERISE